MPSGTRSETWDCLYTSIFTLKAICKLNQNFERIPFNLTLKFINLSTENEGDRRKSPTKIGPRII